MKAVGQVGTNVIYAKIQEFGGTIHAKRGGYLVFEGQDGELVMVRSVTIPAHPYLRPAFDYNRVSAIATIGKVFEALVVRKHTI